MGPYNIRPMTPNDVFFVTELDEDTFGKSLGEPTLQSELLDTPSARYYIAECAGERVGYAGLRMLMPHADIMMIGVAAAFRRQGVGRALLETLTASCEKEGVQALTLEVRASNAVAIAFYTRHGFSVVGTRKRYYQDGEDARMMMRPIGGAR